MAIIPTLSATGTAIQSIQMINAGAAASTTELAAAFSVLTPAQAANLAVTQQLSAETFFLQMCASEMSDEAIVEAWNFYQAAAAKGVDAAATDTLAFSMGTLTTAVWANIKAMAAWLVTTPAGWILMTVAACAAAVVAYKQYNKAIQESIEKAQELQDAYKEASAEISSNISSVNNLASEFKELSKGVGDHGENISLSSDEYERYLDIVEQLVDLNPALVKGYDDEGNAIIEKNNAIQDTIDLLKEQQALELAEATTSDKNWEIAKGLKNAYKQELEDVENAQTELVSALQSALASSVEIGDNYEWKSIGGYDVKELYSQFEKMFGVTGAQGGGINAAQWQSLFRSISSTSEDAGEIIADNLEYIYSLLDRNSDAAVAFNKALQNWQIANKTADRAASAYQSHMKIIAQASVGYDELSDSSKDFVNTWIESQKLTSDMSREQVDEITDSIQNMVGLLATGIEVNGKEIDLNSELDKLFKVDWDSLGGEWYNSARDKAEEIIEILAQALDLSDQQVIDLKVAIGLVIVDENGNQVDARTYYIEQLKQRGLALGDGDLSGFSTSDLKLLLTVNVSGIDNVDDLSVALENVKNKANGASDALNDFSALTKHLTKDTDALKTALSNLKSGNISAIFEEEALDDLLDKFPDLVDELDDYSKGLITAEQLQDAFNNAIADFNADAIYDGVNDVVSAVKEYGAESNKVKQAVQNLAKTIPGLVDALYDEETGHLKVDAAALSSADSLYGVAQASIEAARQSDKMDLSNSIKEMEKIRDTALEAAAAVVWYGNAAEMAQRIDAYDNALGFDGVINNLKQQMADIDSYYDTMLGLLKSAQNRYNRAASSSSDPWKDEFEAYYDAHKHAVAMEQETLTDFYAWLDGQDGYKKYFANNEKYLDEFYKYSEEVFDGLRDLADDAISDGEHQIYLWENQGGHETDIVQKYRDLQTQVHETADSIRNAMRNAGWSELEIENSEIIQSLQKQWWSFEDSIKDVFDSISDTISDHLNDIEHYISMLEHEAGDTGSNDGAILANYAGLKAYVLQTIDEVTAKMQALGYTQTEIANSGVIQELQKKLWDYEDSINDILDTLNDDLYDSMESLLDLVKDMVKQEKEDEKEALEALIDDYKTLVSQRKEMLQLAERERQYEDNVNDKTSEIAKIQARIDALSLDDSRAAAIERASLMEELAEAQKSLDELQRDHSIECTEDALDAELESFEDAQSEKIKIIEDFLDDQGALTKAALDRLDNMNQNLFDNLWSYVSHYTSTSRDELEDMWNSALAAAQNYGSYVDAMNAVKSGSYYTAYGYSSSASSGPSSTLLLVEDLISKMKANSAAWFSGNQTALANENAGYASQISSLIGEKVVRGNDGVWYIGSVGGAKLYDDYKKYCYHTGGVVGNVPTLKQNEVLSLLNKGEVVLTATQQSNLMAMLDQLKPLNALKEALTSFRSSALTSAAAGGPTFQIDAPVYVDGTLPDKQIMELLKNHSREIASTVYSYIKKI